MAHSGKTITFATDLLPNEDNIYNLGTDGQRWKISGTDVTANKVTTFKLATPLTNGSRTAQVETSPYQGTLWKFNASLPVSQLATGDTIIIKTPGAGGSYGVFLSLDNGATYRPISMSGTSRLTTHFSSGIMLILTYNAAGQVNTMRGKVDANGTLSTTTGDNNVTGGRWEVMNLYDSGNSNDSAGYIRYWGSETLLKVTTITYGYQLLFSSGDGEQYIPANTTKKSTANNKSNITTAAIDIFGHIFYHSTDEDISAGSSIRFDRAWLFYRIDLRYSFNIASTLTAGKDVYLVVIPQSNTMATLRNPGATGDNAKATATGANAGPITQTLPNSDDGFLYIKLGKAYNTYCIVLDYEHPIYWYKNNELKVYSGASEYASTAPLAGISDADDLKAIEAISEANGLLKKTAANTWALDTSSYVTSSGVTSVATGAGLTGGTITTTGTIKADLTSETKLTNAAADGTETSGRVYPVRLDKNGKLAVNVPWTNVNSAYLKTDGTNNMSASVNIITGDTDRFINFWYNTEKKAGASWRTGMLGSGSADTNYYVIESGTNTTTATTWNRVLQIGQNTYDAGFAGNIYPITTNSKTLGTSSNKWSNIYSSMANLGSATLDNTAFTSVLSLFHNESNQSTATSFDATKSSWGITFERQWSSGNICSKAAGIFAYGIESWRTGLVFRTKTGTSYSGAHDITALYLNHDGSAIFANTITSKHLYTVTDATYDIGATGTRWRTAYLTTSLLVGAKNTITAYNSNALGSFIGPGVISSCVTGAGGGYHVMGQGVQYARMYISIIGKAGTATTYTNPNDSSQTVTGYTDNVTGVVYLMLGNDKAVGTNGSSYSSPGTAGNANNAQGILRLYGSGSGYGELSYNNTMISSNKSIYLSTSTNSGISNEIRGICATNDYWRVAGGATASNSGYMEIATGDDYNEPIYVRQYQGAFTTLKRTATLLDASGNTEFPVQVTAPKFIGALQGTADLALGLYTSGANSGIWSTTGITAGAIKYVHNINKDTTGLFTHSNNANGILIINTHPNTDDTHRYHHELGFSSNGRLYHRAIINANLNNTTAWGQILTSTTCNDFPADITITKSAPTFKLLGASGSTVIMALERKDANNAMLSSWRLKNESGTLTLQNNWTTSTYFDVMTFAHTSGNITVNKGTFTLASDPTSDMHAATKKYVDALIGANDALVYKGIIAGNNSSDNGGTLTVAASQGHVYKVSTAGYIDGMYCEVGDMLICVTDTDAATTSNYNTIKANWNVIQTSEGSVSTSETSVTDSQIPIFSGATGRFIKNSSKSFSTATPTSSSTDAQIPTAKAVWAAIDALDGNLNSTSAGASKTLTAFSQTNGKVSATFGDIAINESAVTWSNATLYPIGDDIYIGDVNLGGHLGLKSKSASYNTGLIFIKQNTSNDATTSTTGGRITWDGTKFSITSTTAVDASISGNAATATSATNDSDGNAINTTYLKKSGGTLTGEVTLSKANATSNLGIYVSHTNPNSDTTKAKKVALMIGGTSGSGGLYDVTKSKWIVYSDTSGNITLNGNANTASAVAWSGITSKPIYFVTAAFGTTGWQQLNGRNGNISSIVVAKPTDTITWGTVAHSAVIAWGNGDTKGMIDCSYSSPLVSIAGGNNGGSTDAAPKWYFKLSATSGQTYTFPSTSATLVAADGSNASGSWGISITGNAANVTGTVAVANGGTGVTSFTDDCIITSTTSNSKQTLVSRGLKVTGATDADVTVTTYTSGKSLLLTSNGSTLKIQSAANASVAFLLSTGTEMGRFNQKGSLFLGTGGSSMASFDSHRLAVDGNIATTGKVSFATMASNVVTEKVSMQWNSTDQALEFVFA